MLCAQANRLAILIPAYRPSDSLLDVVRALAEKSFPHIVVVDDGSGGEFRDIFKRVAALQGVELLRHATNLGKGAALKTGLNHILCALPDVVGVVTADADGQHHPDDIERVGESLVTHPESLVLGCREFKGAVPLRSRIGNTATSIIMHALMGRKMADTQTGLRGIPAAFAVRLLKLEANGYEFELEMLIAAHKLDVSLVEETIRTIYQPGNPSSHFNPIVDSMKIYFILLRFGSISLLTALLDNLVFILARHQGSSVLLAQILGRSLGLAFNYTMVRSSVFYSHQRHRSVLPKYLLLCLVSGTLSYGGIRLLGAKLGMDAVPAKLIVESLLFLVNFAVQRLFIFKPGNGAPRGEDAPPSKQPTSRTGLFSVLLALVFLAALAVEAHGFRTAGLFRQEIWEPIGVKRFLRYMGTFLGFTIPILMMVPWSFTALIVGFTAVGTVASVGLMPLLAVAFFLISSCALGSRLLGFGRDDELESQVLATLLGAALWIFAMAVVARMPVNYPAVWAALLALPVVLDARGAWRRLERWWLALRGAELRGYAERTAFALVVYVLLAHWFVALLPEVSADGLAMHLAIPANIAAHHALTFEPSRFIWAVMPMGADYAYSIVYLMGGEYAVHLLDYSMLLLVCAALYPVMRRWVDRAVAFLLLAVFASTPLVQLVTGSLFVENVLAAMIVGMMAALWRFSESGQKRFLWLSAALAGTAMATKFGALAFVVLAIPFLAIEAVRHWKSLGSRPLAACGIAALLMLAMAAPPYAIAFGKTGNPLFPFLNQKFPSKFLPADATLVDQRYLRTLNWTTLYDLTFRTRLYYEGQNGSFGFQYLVMVPLAVAAVLLVRRKGATATTVSAAVVALGAGAIIMATQPNARYVYAVLPLLSIPFASLLGWTAGTRWLYRSLLVFAAACFVLNMRFMPSASYYHRDFCLRVPFSSNERDKFRAENAPIREVIAYFNRAHPNAPVLLISDSANAGLTGEIYENHWHQMMNLSRIEGLKSVSDAVQLMRSWKVEYFISHVPGVDDEIKPPVLREMLERCTQAEFGRSYEYLARLQPTCRPVLEPPGYYDDFDQALQFRGDWIKDTSFYGPDRNTITYSDAPAAEAAILFQGTAITYTYSKAPNRGIASVTVDGMEQPPVDLYSAHVAWQSHTRFCCFAAGSHTAVIRVTGQANPKSTGKFIDVDSFVVE